MGEIAVNLLLEHKFKHCIMCQDQVPQIIETAASNSSKVNIMN